MRLPNAYLYVMYAGSGVTGVAESSAEIETSGVGASVAAVVTGGAVTEGDWAFGGGGGFVTAYAVEITEKAILQLRQSI